MTQHSLAEDFIQTIETELKNVLESFIGRTNDNFTRSDIRDSLGLFLRGVMYPASLLTGYTIICDETNNSPMNAADGELNVLVEIRGIFPGSAWARIELRVRRVRPTRISYPSPQIHDLPNYQNVHANINTNLEQWLQRYNETVGYGYYEKANSKMTAENTAAQPKTGKLAPVVLTDTTEDDQTVTLTLDPEPNMSGAEALQLIMMVEQAQTRATEFSPLLFIKEQGLERHFKISR